MWELCADWFAEDYYDQSATNDPSGPPTGTGRVRRGGNRGDYVWCCRSVNRLDVLPDYGGALLGFRVACEIPLSPQQTAAGATAGLPGSADAGKEPPTAVAPFDATTAKKRQQAWADHLGTPVEREIDLPGGNKLTMALILRQRQPRRAHRSRSLPTARWALPSTYSNKST